MNGTWRSVVLIFLILACASLAREQTSSAEPRSDPAIWVREDFSLSLAAADIEGARLRAFAPDGMLFVPQPDRSRVLACRDENGDGYYEKTAVFVKGHPTVHGLFWYAGWLWFTESGAIFKARDTTGDSVADEQQTVIPNGQLPKGGRTVNWST